jgi:hypothetical protein
MNRQSAQEILLLYRPGTADEEDPAFKEALRCCGEDPELARWFQNHCEVYLALRSRFRAVSPPDGLREQIVGERKLHVEPAPPRRYAVAGLLTGAALAALLLVFLWAAPREDLSFAGFRERLVSRALRGYAMDLFATNAVAVRSYLAQEKAPSEYELPTALEKASLIGCGIVQWQGAPVTMVCFKSGRELRPGQANDLWLFVIDRRAAPRNKLSPSPLLRRVNRASTACWASDEKIYVLVADGDETFLRKYL